jgi:hypothetical protein
MAIDYQTHGVDFEIDLPGHGTGLPIRTRLQPRREQFGGAQTTRTP